LKFPERVYTEKEVKIARALAEKGYKHNLAVEGSPNFQTKS